MSFTLVMNDGKGAGKCFSYTKNKVTVGRLKENDLVLYNTGVSRTHCIITMYSHDRYAIEDAGSSNGTVVNGVRIANKVQLNDNDLITIGPVSFQFRISDTMPGAAGPENEHYEDNLEGLGMSDMGIQANKTQALSAADVRRSREAIRIAQQAQAAQQAQQQAATPEAAQTPKAETAPAAAEGSSATGRPRRVTGQRRQSGASAEMGHENSAAEENGGKRVTGDPARRARLAEAKQAGAKAAEPAEVEPIKETTQKVKPRVPFSVWFKELPNGRKAMLAAGAAIVLLGGGFGIYKLATSDSSNFSDNSEKVFALNNTNSSRSYGVGKKVKVACRDKVSFSFDYNGGLAVMRYSVKDIDSPNELAIYVNNQLVGYAPIATRWLNDVQVKLPSAMLKAHGKNVITFDSALNPPQNDRWAVRQVTIQEKALPEPDPERAMQFFSLAQESYKSYLVDPANLSTAIGHYNDALVFLEKLDPKPPLYGQIEVALKEAEDALQKIYDDKIYQSYRAERSRDYEEARNILNELLRYLPNMEDKRRQEVQNRLKNLGQR